jgi:hypothetical protein
MAAVKGKQKVSTEFVKELFVGFTAVKVVAVNPSREEVNALVGRENSSDDEPIKYLGNDQEGNDRLRLAFWLQDLKSEKLFVHSFNITNKERKNKDGDKVQLVNSTCTTTWVPYLKKGDVVTDKIDESVIQDWFLNFMDKDKNKLGVKKYRKALAGEEELVTLLRVWLGRMKFSDPEAEVMLDTKKLFKENFKELREIISLDEKGEFTAEGYDAPFVILLGVRTDKEDPSKKYQQVWSKGFLPDGFMRYINNGNKFPSAYTKKTWDKFQSEVIGDYGFDGFTKLEPIQAYDETEDISGGDSTGQEAPDPASSDYNR